MFENTAHSGCLMINIGHCDNIAISKKSIYLPRDHINCVSLQLINASINAKPRVKHWDGSWEQHSKQGLLWGLSHVSGQIHTGIG